MESVYAHSAGIFETPYGHVWTILTSSLQAWSDCPFVADTPCIQNGSAASLLHGFRHDPPELHGHGDPEGPEYHLLAVL